MSAPASEREPPYRPLGWPEQQRWWEHYEHENARAFALRASLQLRVPLKIAELRAAGGPGEADYERVRGYVIPTDNDFDAGEMGLNSLLALGGEAIQYPRAVRKGAGTEWVTKLVDALAVLAFAPRGVRLFGLHFEAAP